MVLDCGVAGGSFECGEPGGEGDVEEGDGWEGEELVVGLHEEVGEHGPAGGGVELLHDISSGRLS